MREFIYEIPIRYAEVDRMNVVYHGNYLLYLEDARSTVLSDLGFPYTRIEEAGYGAPMVNLSIQYKKPLSYGDTAIVKCVISELGVSKISFEYEIYQKNSEGGFGPLCSTAKTTLCFIDLESFKPIKMKTVLPDLYSAFKSCLDESNSKE